MKIRNKDYDILKISMDECLWIFFILVIGTLYNNFLKKERKQTIRKRIV